MDRRRRRLPGHPRSRRPAVSRPAIEGSFDIERARRDTPAAEKLVHLNNAGAALPPLAVTQAVISHLQAEATEGGYEAAAAADEAIADIYRNLALLIGAHTDEIALVENATRAWETVLYGLRISPGDRILTCRCEYSSNLIALLHVARRTGAVIEVVDDDQHGQVSVADLRRRLAAGGTVRLVAVTHVPTNSGLVNPAEEVGAAAREAGVPYLLDACQSVGQLQVDVERIGCDALAATGRKFLRGPRGTGFLYVRRSWLDQLDPPFLDNRSADLTDDGYRVRPDAQRFESWESNVAAKIGLGVAAAYALDLGMDAIEERVGTLAETLRGRLEDRDGVRVHDPGVRRCGIVTFTVDGVSCPEVKQHLADAGINVTYSLAGESGPYLQSRGLDGVVRASPHYYNTFDELDRLVEALPAPLRH